MKPATTGNQVVCSVQAEHEVQYPASSGVRAWRSQVAEDVLVVAPGLFEGVGENGQVIEGAFVEHLLSHRSDIGREPFLPRLRFDGAEKEGAEQVSQDVRLLHPYRAVPSPSGLGREGPVYRLGHQILDP